jgi:hypothetical protein
VRGLEAQQPAAGDHGAVRAVALREGADAERVLGRAQDEAARRAEAVDVGHEAR